MTHAPRLHALAVLWVLALTFLARRAAAQPIPGGGEKSPPVPVTGGLGRGYTLRAEDDSFLFNFRLRMQLQGSGETKAESPAGGQGERPDVGFFVRRLRVVFQGHAVDKSLRYYVQLGFSPRDQESDLIVPVRDAQLIWTGVRDLNVRFGQMKVPFNRERVISSSALGMVDRSNVNAELNLDRDVGIMLQSRDLFGLGDVLRYNLGVFGGDGRNRSSPDTGMLYAARLEVAPLGAFDDYSEADLRRSPGPRLSLGVASAYSEATRRSRGTHGDTLRTGTLDYRHGAADLIFKMGGVSLQAEVLFRRSPQTSIKGTGPTGTPLTEFPRNGWGTMIQAGFLVNDRWEISLRHGEIRPLGGGNGGLLRDREIGGALSFYARGHDLKIQVDYFRLLTDADATGDVVLARHRVRLQTQLFF